jgi:hypothetical protein
MEALENKILREIDPRDSPIKRKKFRYSNRIADCDPDIHDIEDYSRSYGDKLAFGMRMMHSGE